MKLNPFRLIFFLSSVILLSSCLGTNTPTATSSDPTFVSLTLAGNDSVTKGVFTLVDNTIVNVDSLPFTSKVDSVFPTFTFKSSAATKLKFPKGYKFKKDSAFISGKDTIDFRQPITLINYAADGKTPAYYTVKVNVHQVDPELYIWKPVSGNLNSINSINQKAIILNDKIFYYQNDGSNNVTVSNDGYSWATATLSGLPANAAVNKMLQLNGKLFLLQDGTMYSSGDGLNWTSNACSPASYTYKTLLVTLSDSIRALVQSADQTYRFAASKDGLNWLINNTVDVPDNFPVSDFSSVSFNAPTGKAKALVLSGYSRNNNLLKNNWSTEDGLYWVDFSTANHTMDTLAIGASVISYDSKLFLFGLRTNDGKTFYKVSNDEGLSWQRTDSIRNVLPVGYLPRNYQSVVVFKPSDLKGVQPIGTLPQILQSNRIFIVGGKNGSTTYSDIWTGKLNRKNFLRQ